MSVSAFPRPAPQLAHLLKDIAAVAADDRPRPELPYSWVRRYERDGDRLQYERRYFQRRARLVALAAEAMLRPDSDLDPLSDELWSVCDEYLWGLPAHLHYAESEGRTATTCVDLFAAETAHLLAETVSALAGALDGRVADRVRGELERRIFEPMLDPRPFRWEGFGNNWEAVCGGAAGLAALAVLDDGPRRQHILDRCTAAMHRFLDSYGDDGGCVEGVDYWVYGFGYFFYFAHAAGSPLLDLPKVRRMASFPQRAAFDFADGAFVPFSDASARPFLPAGLLTELASRYGTRPPAVIPSLYADHCYRWAHLSRTLAWYRPLPAPAQDPGQIRDIARILGVSDGAAYFADLGWVVDPAGFAAKGGHNDEPHNHLDLGHFLLRTATATGLDDLGAGLYTKDYFGARRYESLHPSARAHSVPEIDGHTQLPGRSRRADILHHRDTPGGIEFDLDLTAAYDVDGLRRLVRRFRWNRTAATLELTDEITAGRPLMLTEVFVSRQCPTAGGWPGIDLAYAGGEAAVEEATGPDHRGCPDTAYRLLITNPAAAGVSHHRFTFRISG